MPFALYFGTSPAPEGVTREQLARVIPVHFTTEQDALHGAALVLRGGQHPWLIEGPGVTLEAAQIAERCQSILRLLNIASSRK